jgi:RNA polymerase sigma-70 factor, ECF subfamily
VAVSQVKSMRLDSAFRKPGSVPAGAESELVQAAVARAKEGDMQALHFLYVRFAEDVRRYVESFVRERHQAEDLTQDVFVKLIKVIGKYEPREVPFSAWILRVARNAALDYLRAQRITPCAQISLADDERSQIARQRSHDLREAFDCLPIEQREVLVLRHIVGLSPVEIAEVLGKSESSVHGLHHRGRLRFKAALSELGAAPVVAGQAGQATTS